MEYWRELRVPEPERFRWWEEARILLDRNLMLPGEKERFEEKYFPKRDTPDPEGMARTVVEVSLKQFGSAGLEEIASEREFRAKYDTARGDLARAKFHALVAAGLRQSGKVDG